MNNTKHLLKLWRSSKTENKEVNKTYSINLVEKIANFFSSGDFYYYIFNSLDSKVDFVHPNVQNVLSIAPEEFSVEKFLDKVHPEDINFIKMKEKVAMEFLLKEIPPEKIPHYKISYMVRIQTSKNKDKTILNQGVALTVTDDQKIEYLLVIHTDISHLEVAFDHKVSIMDLEGQASWHCKDPDKPHFIREDFYESFSKREHQILSLISEGKSSGQIADQLFISIDTVRAHRKNILAKTKCKNTTELVAKCIKAGYI